MQSTPEEAICELRAPHSVAKNSHSPATRTAVPTYFPPALWLHLISVSTPLPQPPVQPALLRFTSESVWP